MAASSKFKVGDVIVMKNVTAYGSRAPVMSRWDGVECEVKSVRRDSDNDFQYQLANRTPRPDFPESYTPFNWHESGLGDSHLFTQDVKAGIACLKEAVAYLRNCGVEVTCSYSYEVMETKSESL